MLLRKIASAYESARAGNKTVVCADRSARLASRRAFPRFSAVAVIRRIYGTRYGSRTRSIQLSPVYIRIGRPACSTKRTDLAHYATTGGRDEAKAPAAERLQRGRVVDVRGVGCDQHEPLVEQNHLRIAAATAIESREARPCRVPRHRDRLRRRRFRDRLAHGGHQLARDVERVRIVRVREHDDADLVVELNERLRRVARISAAMSDVRSVVDATHVEAERGAGRPVLFDRAHAVHLAQRSGAHDAIAAARASAELRRDELRHVLDVGRDAGGRRHAARVDEREHFARPVRHAAAVRHGESRNVLVDARRGHAERLEDVAVDVVGPPFAAHLFDDHAGDREREVRILPPHRRSECRLSVGIEAAELVGRRELDTTSSGRRLRAAARSCARGVARW